jgi:hypothetical protein
VAERVFDFSTGHKAFTWTHITMGASAITVVALFFAYKSKWSTTKVYSRPSRGDSGLKERSEWL